MLKSMGHADAIHPSDEVAPRPSLTVLSHLPAMLRMMRRHRSAARVVAEHEVRTQAYVQRFAAADPRTLSDAEIWSAIEDWFRDAPEYMQTVLLLGGVLFHEAPVWKACATVGFPFERLVYPQLAAGARSVSAQQAFDLVALADVARNDAVVCRYLKTAQPTLERIRVALQGTAFLAAFERFLEQYGHRGRYEYDWSLPRYREDPTPLLQTLRAHLADRPGPQDQATPEQREREAERAWAAFEARLSWWQRLTMLPAVRRAVATIKRYYVWREQVRSDLVHILEVLREWHLVLAGRFVERGWLSHTEDYFLVHYREIAPVLRGTVPPDSLRRIVVDRRNEQDGHRRMRLPLLMRVSELPALIRGNAMTGGAAAGGTLTGQPVSVGVVEADVVVVRDPGDFSRMKRGCILVAPATDPSWTPLFTLASGVVVEVGGVLSHASTIAREYGIPALANVKNATRLLRTGERIRLDATTGRIDRLQPAAATPVSDSNDAAAEHAGVA
jgi:pyruvate,water dikinase